MIYHGSAVLRFHFDILICLQVILLANIASMQMLSLLKLRMMMWN